MPDAHRPRNYPVGIPIEPPPGWRPRSSSPPPLPRPTPSPRGFVVQTVLVGVMVVVCTAVGWLLVQQPRKPRLPGEARVSKADQPEKDRAPTPEPSAPPGLSYEKAILPIVKRTCLSCHHPGKKRGGLDLSTLAALNQGGDSGAVVRPGKPDDSPLYESIATGKMPPSGKKLSGADRRLIHDWIAAGARGGAP